ncbi:threonine-phosphate decarboxylase CobD [Commensalibacter oyaizuii]|uniref:threonine-phosphate decarboxylase n=1 Tax=Commensalibacter oyaizuii TaxID=3043873 RepID=A0ABT6Q1E8_9PROT|nr:threonine-phosphate decarboxylase CobD [Commensalibacter sp. TBRC 16381]MDI2090916.1 threonine-phosphate decarboxylase CobD [Commensalibacter sp. TBRC 16381]
MYHGGQLGEAKRQFPNATQPWLDLSTGINPYAYPYSCISIDHAMRLPFPEDEEKLRAQASKSYGLLNKELMVSAPGTQILISLLPYIFDVRQVCVLSPTYMEHILTWKKANIPVYPVYDFDQFSSFSGQKKTLGILCNPNNPDGRIYRIKQIEQLADRWSDCGNHLLVDEAFMDFEDKGVASLLPHQGISILRSFGKTYGLAGVRLGFLLSDYQRVEKCRQILGPWAVSGHAIQIALQAFKDRLWFEATKAQLKDHIQRFDRLLAHYLCPVIGGTHLFRLVEYEQANALWHWLANCGIWVRRFDYNHRWLRFGLPHSEIEWDRLENALKDYFSSVVV